MKKIIAEVQLLQQVSLIMFFTGASGFEGVMQKKIT